MMRVPEDSVQSPQGANTRPAMRAPQESLTPSDFVYGHVLGLGSYSKVVKAKRKDTSEVLALKIMDKKHIIRENKVKFVKMERMILDQLDFPGVVRLCFTFQDVYCLYMALECCSGGELFDQIRRKGRMHQKEVRFYAAEIVEILEYIHSQGVIHRDLKKISFSQQTDTSNFAILAVQRWSGPYPMGFSSKKMVINHLLAQQTMSHQKFSPAVKQVMGWICGL